MLKEELYFLPYNMFLRFLQIDLTFVKKKKKRTKNSARVLAEEIFPANVFSVVEKTWFLFIEVRTYLLLTEFEVSTVSYGSKFMAHVRSVRAINQREKRGSVTYSTD